MLSVCLSCVCVYVCLPIHGMLVILCHYYTDAIVLAWGAHSMPVKQNTTAGCPVWSLMM